MKTSPYILLSLFLFLTCLKAHACSLTEHIRSTYSGVEEINPGAITDTIYCSDDKQHFYSIFVPSTYKDDKSWPIIYFFEPAARGKLPLTLYHEIAEEHGLILACSYQSRNGPIKDNEFAYKKISIDVNSKFNIDRQRIYFSGFSGGGRFSQYLAQSDDNIAGVISVAGPKGDQRLFNIETYATPYTGVVGTRDMNYLEHRQFQETLDQVNIPNALFTYNAAHQWPPKEVYALAVEWHMAQYDFSQSMDNTSPIVSKYIKKRTAEIDTSASYTILDRHRSYNALIKNFAKPNNYGIAERLASIASDKQYKKSKKQEVSILENELENQLEYVNALSEFRKYFFQAGVNPDSARYSKQWWKSEISKLRAKAKQGDAKGLSSARQIDFLRGQLHNNVQNAKTLNKGDLILGMHEINLLLYPSSVWFNWQHAILLAQYESKKKALTYLKQSKKINQSALDQIRQNPAFSGLKNQYPYLFN